MSFGDILNKIKINDAEFYRLNTLSDVHFPLHVITTIKEKFDPKYEKGGLIRFTYSISNGTLSLVAKDIIFLTNSSENPRSEYSPNKEELNTAYKNSFSENLLPLAFHTHPTIYHDNDNIIHEGMHYLEQLNTSLADKGYTLRDSYKYKDIKMRLPDILIVENANAVFIGIYGGLIAPMCFTKQKEKASQEVMEKTASSIKKWANTPERKAVLVFSAFALVILGVRYYKVSIPSLIGASIILLPLAYSTRERCDFFGVSYGLALTIHIPRIEDKEIAEYETKAIEAREKSIKERKKKRK